MGPDYWVGHGFGYMWIFPVIFLLVFVFFMRGMFGQNNNSNNYGSGDGSSSHRSESAREILDKRFAKGEINKDEYEEMKKALGHDNA